MTTVTWKEAINTQKLPTTYVDSYTEGFRSGWFDVYLGLNSMIARTSPWGYYAMGYVDGRLAYRRHNPIVQEEDGVTCLKNLFV